MDWNESYESGRFKERWDYAHPSQELVAAVAVGLAPRGGHALDLGCGAGAEAVFLAQCGLAVTGVDLSGKALEIAAERAAAAGVEVEWKRGDVLKLPVVDASIDFANDRGCFHHIPERHRDRYAAEVARVLKLDGRLLLRGCRRPSGETFVVVTEESIDRHFTPDRFSRSPVLPITLVSDAGTLESSLVVLRRR